MGVTGAPKTPAPSAPPSSTAVAASRPAPALAATSATLRLGDHDVVADVTLDVQAGEVLALVGPNGAGKSSLLALLSGERAPTSGAVLLDGHPLHSHSHQELARRRSVLTQENQLSFPFLVREVVEMGRAPWQRTEREVDDEAAVGRASTRADIVHLLGRRFTELSGGERARVSLARVLAQDTPIVLLDEPTAALDLRHQEDVLGICRDLAADGRAVVIVVHDLTLAAAVADRVALLSAARLAAIGTPADVLQPALLSDVYGLAVGIHEVEGQLVVVPHRARPASRAPQPRRGARR